MSDDPSNQLHQIISQSRRMHVLSQQGQFVSASRTATSSCTEHYSIIQSRKDEKLIDGQSFSSRSRTILTGARLNEHGEQAQLAEGDLLFLVPPRDEQSLLRSAPAGVIRIRALLQACAVSANMNWRA